MSSHEPLNEGASQGFTPVRVGWAPARRRAPSPTARARATCTSREAGVSNGAMRVPATILSLAAVAVLLLPWQVCSCSQDGTHLKPLWDASDCPHEQDPAGSDEHDDECTDLVRFAGTEAADAVALPPAVRASAELPHALTASVLAWGRPEAAWSWFADPGEPPPPAPTLVGTTRQQI